MNIKTNLRRRIVVVFALMSAFVAAMFGIGIYMTEHFVESRLITIDLENDLHRLLNAQSTNEWSHRPEREELFFVEEGLGDLATPQDLEYLHPGFQEITREGKEYYALVNTVADRRYVLLRDQSGFEKRERMLLAIVFIGFVLSVLLAVLLGRVLATRVIAPVARLSHQVRHRDQLLSLAPPLSPDYADDEVGELAISFDHTLGQLRAALGREKLFTSDVSHELRTPLMVLASSSELLLESACLDERGRAKVLRITQATSDMRQLVETFLMLARDNGAHARNGPRATVQEVASDLIEVWRKPVEEKGLQLIFSFGADSGTSYNATLLHSVMGNLLRNAWHYTDAGYIKLSLFENGFSVEDSGSGIPEDKQAAMSQPFVRGDEQRGEGLGVGLSLVNRICAYQRWQVTLSDRPSSGCCFRVELRPLETDSKPGRLN
ncbi:HAMP domain-containing histidine kinase [Pseudomonas syringae pv. theae]|uniref:sensor histidine kinase n=1 Tax=Pseudomonas syringae TaxID=317 RepID=UPI0023D0E58C|nr:HAMP domain-containing sensor histidine kinase [Pseudomonas syringae]GKS04846.1 HAMP domain-containing histidine kinase [Pseudomonas syringae pv. theae]